jgi:hypothetical protein
MSVREHNSLLREDVEFKHGVWTYLAVLVGGIGFGTAFLYLFIVPARPDAPWGRLISLGLALWIYYTVFVAPLKLRVASEGIEARGVLARQFIPWNAINRFDVRDAYTFGGDNVSGVPLYNSIRLIITGTKSKIRFGFGPPWGRRYKEDLPLLLRIIEEKTGKKPEE